MDSIITYLISIIDKLLLFISQYIPLNEIIFYDSTSPEYIKFKVDKLPTIRITNILNTQNLSTNEQ